MKQDSRVNDLFLVHLDDAIIDNYEKILIDLYQPFIGWKAVALYLTLKNSFRVSEPTSYHKLITKLSCDFAELRQEFVKLEAANLLTTYEGNLDEFAVFIYQVNTPLSHYQFLKDLMLVKVLTSFIGEEALVELKNNEQARTAHINKIADLKNISHLLKDVYQVNLKTALVDQEMINDQQPAITPKAMNKFNFDTFLILLPTSVRIGYDFTAEIRQLIFKLAEMYDLDSEQMALIVNTTLQKYKGIITEQSLRKEAYNYVIADLRRENLQYEMKQVEKDAHRTSTLTPAIQNPDVQKALSQMKRLDAREYVKMITGSLTPQDYKNIERLALEYHLEQEVINVLINYVYHSKKTLSLPLMEAIAQSWHKQKITTAEAAYQALRENERKTKKRKLTKTKTAAKRTENKSNFADQKLDADEVALVEKLFEELGE